LFEEASIIQKRDFGDGRMRYELIDKQHHHDHLIDMQAGKIIEFHNAELDKLKRKIASDMGYELIGCRLELYGLLLSDNKPHA
jgi:Fur family ferric uptake transcriptional regulator